MGLFDLFKKEKKKEETLSIALAMPLFKNGESYDLNAAISHLNNFWNLDIQKPEGDKNSAVIKMNGYMIAIAFMPAPVPGDDIEGTAQYAYNWPKALEELKDHTGHAIVSVIGGSSSAKERYSTLTMLLHAILSTSNAVGVYQGNETLLIPKGQYLEFSGMLKDGGIPVPLWVYIGLRKNGDKNSVYTFGLKSFGKKELEIIDSTENMDALYDFVLNICSYIISSDVTLNPGETFGYTAEQKISISSAKGAFTEGEVLRLGL